MMTILTQAQMNALQVKLTNGNIIGFYTDLETYGDPYGRLGLAVTRNDTWQGELANGFAASGATDNNVNLEWGSADWISLNANLASRHLQTYINNNGNSPTYDQVQEYHNDEYDLKGLDEDDWFVNKLLNDSSDPAGTWLDYMSNDGLVDLGDDAWGVAKSGAGLLYGPTFLREAYADNPDEFAEKVEFARNFLDAVLNLSEDGRNGLIADATDPSFIALAEFVNNLPDAYRYVLNDYGWALENPDAIANELLPDWLQGALAPVLGVVGIRPPVISGGGGDPLVIDLDADGHIEMTSLEDGVYFDLWGDGEAKKISWVAPDDGFLAIDENGNGKIDGVSEMFGIGQPLSIVADEIFSSTENGFTELASHDSNDDGMINNLDDVWSSLVVWQDVNQNGTTIYGR